MSQRREAPRRQMIVDVVNVSDEGGGQPNLRHSYSSSEIPSRRESQSSFDRINSSRRSSSAEESKSERAASLNSNSSRRSLSGSEKRKSERAMRIERKAREKAENMVKLNLRIQELKDSFYFNKMPSLARIAQMKDVQVYKVLSKLPISKYRGVAAARIKKMTTQNEAQRYLTELAVANERNRSDLHLVSEQGSSLEQSSSFNSLKLLRKSPFRSSESQQRIPSLKNISDVSSKLIKLSSGSVESMNSLEQAKQQEQEKFLNQSLVQQAHHQSEQLQSIPSRRSQSMKSFKSFLSKGPIIEELKEEEKESPREEEEQRRLGVIYEELKEITAQSGEESVNSEHDHDGVPLMQQLSGITENNVEEHLPSAVCQKQKTKNPFDSAFLQANKLIPKGPPPNFNHKARKIDSIKVRKPIQVSFGISSFIDQQEQLANTVFVLPEPKKSSGILENKGKLA